MPLFNDKIKDFAVGDDYPVQRKINKWPTGGGLTVVKAWLTVKEKYADEDAAAIFQKVITTVVDTGNGHISSDGSGGTVVMDFYLLKADTALLTADKDYVFDVQIKDSDTFIRTYFSGTIKGKAQVTKAAA